MMSLETAKAECESRVMQLPNVVGVGIGMRDERKVITVFVTRKLPASALSPEETIPRSVGGWDTDVEEIGDVTAT